MVKIGYIYKITSPTGKIYIGQTTRLNDRIAKYKSCSHIEEQRMLYNSIKKHSWENHIFEIITEAPYGKLLKLEIQYIKEHNSFHYDNPNGMNLTRGGEGSLGRKDTPETIQKRINNIKGKKRSEQTKQLMSELKKGKPSNHQGKICSEETKQKISTSNKGRLPSNTTKQNRNNTRLINLITTHSAILQINKTTNEVIKEWVMLPKNIAKHFNVCDSNIVKCLNGKKEYTMGCIWRYKK
jgi:group I intron endonuclease